MDIWESRQGRVVILIFFWKTTGVVVSGKRIKPIALSIINSNIYPLASFSSRREKTTNNRHSSSSGSGYGSGNSTRKPWSAKTLRHCPVHGLTSVVAQTLVWSPQESAPIWSRSKNTSDMRIKSNWSGVTHLFPKLVFWPGPIGDSVFFHVSTQIWY